MIQKWNIDKPHRCPECHTIAVSGYRPKWYRVYTCCQCKTEFCKWPKLGFVFRHAYDTCYCFIEEGE